MEVILEIWTGLYEGVLSFFQRPFGEVVRDCLDIGLVATLVYWGLVILRGTRAMQMAVGLALLFAGYLASVNRTVIAEVPFDPHRLTELLAQDKANNPSHYSICVISEGAKPLAGELMESGEADAYGHRKLGGISDWVGDFIRRTSGEDVLVQRLAYLMRSGPPDSLDRLVAYNFGNMVYDRIEAGCAGELMAIQNGCYTTVPVRELGKGKRKVDVASFYDPTQYLPKIQHVRGKPMFLY